MRWIVVIALFVFAGPAAAQQPGDVRREPFTLELGDQKVDTELAHLTVRANHAREDGGTIEIAYVVLPAKTASPAAPIVYLDGGPGGSGISTAGVPYMAELFEKLRDVADVVLVDQRGTGRAIPRLACGAEEPVPGDIFASRARMIELHNFVAERCASRFRAQGVDLSDYDTVESADDLDDLRQAFGVERISLLGFSYGTHLAMATMRRHGDRLERVVLAGTEGPGQAYKFPSTYDAQVRAIARLAAADPTIDAPDLEATLRQVLDRLARNPVTVKVMDMRRRVPVELTIGAEGFLYLLRRDIGDTNDLPLFPAWIYEMANGGTTILERYATRRYNEAGRGVSVMSLAVDCASGVDPARLHRIEEETPGSIFGAMTNQLDPEACESVDVEDLGAAFRAPVESDVPTLFVSGTLDSNTPPAQAEEARKGFLNSAHIVVENAGHESTLPVPEVRELIASFLAGRDVEDRRIVVPALAFEPVPEIAVASDAPAAFDPAGRWAFETIVGGQPVTGTIAVEREGEALAISIEAAGIPPLDVVSASMEGPYLMMVARQPDGTEIEFRLQGVESGIRGHWTVGGRTGGEIAARREAS